MKRKKLAPRFLIMLSLMLAFGGASFAFSYGGLPSRSADIVADVAPAVPVADLKLTSAVRSTVSSGEDPPCADCWEGDPTLCFGTGPGMCATHYFGDECIPIFRQLASGRARSESVFAVDGEIAVDGLPPASNIPGLTLTTLNSGERLSKPRSSLHAGAGNGWRHIFDSLDEGPREGCIKCESDPEGCHSSEYTWDDNLVCQPLEECDPGEALRTVDLLRVAIAGGDRRVLARVIREATGTVLVDKRTGFVTVFGCSNQVAARLSVAPRLLSMIT
jgi:hypothetical protein